MSLYAFEKHSNYCNLQFSSQICNTAWPEIETAAKDATQLIHDSNVTSVLVDLTQIDSMPEGFVAVLLRIWRGLSADNRQMVLATDSDTVNDQLKLAGLASLWTITESRAKGCEALGVEDQGAALSRSETENSPAAPANTEGNKEQVSSEDTSATDNPVAKNVSATATTAPAEVAPPFGFEDQRGFCSVQFNPVLMTMNWADVEAKTTEVIGKVQASKNNSVMVDLSNMDIINSGLVASLVRIWKTMKENSGQFSLVSPNDSVTDVLKTAGLWKLWTVVDDREEAVYELGAGEVATVEKRERRLLALVSVPCAVLAAIALAFTYASETLSTAVNAQLTAMLLAAAAISTGLLSILKDNGVGRVFSLLAVLISIGVISSMAFEKNPMKFATDYLDKVTAQDDQSLPVIPKYWRPASKETEDESPESGENDEATGDEPASDSDEPSDDQSDVDTTVQEKPTASAANSEADDAAEPDQ